MHEQNERFYKEIEAIKNTPKIHRAKTNQNPRAKDYSNRMTELKNSKESSTQTGSCVRKNQQTQR